MVSAARSGDFTISDKLIPLKILRQKQIVYFATIYLILVKQKGRESHATNKIYKCCCASQDANMLS